jgi:hypothetical protein
LIIFGASPDEQKGRELKMWRARPVIIILLFARLPVMLLAEAGRLVLHMAPCTGRAKVVMAFYRDSFLPIKCSGETRNDP